MTQKFQHILGIRFFIGDMEGLLELCKQGHFIVVPSAPTLAYLTEAPDYRESAEKSDFAITDSAFMVVLWRIYTGQRLPRISGLKLLRSLMETPALKQEGSSFWIMPSTREKEINLSWFRQHNYPIREEDCLVAPMYDKGPIVDSLILSQIENRKPRFIIINLGGGVQERVGYFLKKNLSYRPTILCVGAAIAFITGIQAHIPPWADAWGLGWLFRCLSAPRKFIPRYWNAMRVVGLLFKYREKSVTS